MKQRLLGRTGLKVSEISLGTVQLGMPYGIPDSSGRLPTLSEAQSLEILRQSFSEGINFLDTARGYGDSEAIIGRALKKWPGEIHVATKLEPLSDLMSDEEIAKSIRSSIETSRQTLNLETIDLLQLHNATDTILEREVVLDMFAYARYREWIRFQGVTTYGTEAPRKALKQGYWDTVQIEFNLFNQAAKAIFEEAHAKGIAIIIRSAMLKGSMTTSEEDIPEHLKVLRRKAEELPVFFGRKDSSIAEIALLFILSHPQVSTVLSGVINVEQLLENIKATTLPIFTQEELERAETLQIKEPQLTDPRQWNSLFSATQSIK